MALKITFDYNQTAIIIEDPERETKVWKRNDFLNNRGNVITSYGATWRLAVFNYILHMGYPYVDGNHYNAVEHFSYLGEQNLHRVVGHLNETIFKDYPFLHIDDKSYRLNPDANKTEIEWVIDCNKEEILENHQVERYMQSANKQTLIDTIIRHHSVNASDNNRANGMSIVKEGTFYTVTPADDVILWNNGAIEKAVYQYNGRIKTINEDLLPTVTVADTEYSNLPDYICNHYVKNPRRTEDGASFAVVEAGPGAGKTYSLYATAKKLTDNHHIAIVVELFELFSKNGKQSLLEYLAQFLIGNNGGDTEVLFRDLLGKEENKNGREKTVFIIDGIDEIPINKYPRLALELDALARIDNPNIFFILGTRNAPAFTQNSGIEKGITSFLRWDNIKLNPLSLDILTEKEERLHKILNKNKNTRTPLFVTCFREIQSLRNEILYDTERNFNFKEYIGENNIDIIDGIDDFDSYYDLFNLKTALLIAHAVKNKVHPIWYSDVLPCVAYYLYTSGANSINFDELERLFGKIVERSVTDDVFAWFNRRITSRYGAFKSLFPKEKVSWLLNTGFVRCIENENSFKLEHFEYMQFLAAKFASTVIREITDNKIRESVIRDIVRMTSFFDEDGIERGDKMRNIPFAHYVVLDIKRSGQIIHPDIIASCKKNKKYELVSGFDPGYYRIIANVMYEGIDLYDEAKELIDSYMLYKRGVMIGEAERIAEYDDWRLLYSTNVILYSMLTKRNDVADKWAILNRIYKDLSICAAIVARDAYASIGKLRDFTKRSICADYGWKKDFNMASIEYLTKYAEECDSMPDVFGDYKTDTLSMLYSNLGATQQEMAKYVHRHPDTANSLSENQYLNDAVDYHTHALNFRKAIAEKISDPKSVSVIRSYIALGTDEYYAGSFSKEYLDAKKHFESAVDNYYNKALERQGIDPKKISGYGYDTRYSENRTLPVLEVPHVDAEPNVICLRAAGAYFMLYSRAKEEYKKIIGRGIAEKSERLKDEINDILCKQFDYLKAAYLFTVEQCESLSDDKRTRILNSVKLEINSSEIDKLMDDVEERYIYSFAYLGDKKNAGRELIEKVFSLYKALHIYSNKELHWPDAWND